MILKNLTKNFYVGLIITIFIFLSDRVSKMYVIHLSNKFMNSEIFSSKFLNISLVWNEGIAFGLFSFNQVNLYNTLTIIISLVILIVFVLIIKNEGFKKYAFLMIFGGAIGNLFDRIIYNAVPDFIDFHIGKFHWFVFNVADIFITFGIIIVIVIEIVDKNKNTNDQI
jgi:signal peptidase II